MNLDSIDVVITPPASNRASASRFAGTQAVQRSVALLRLLSAHPADGLRLIDIHRRSGIERPTVHRILQGLIAEGMVRQDDDSKHYFLGPLVYELGLAATPRLALRDICMPHLQALADATGDTVFMTVRSGFDGVCIARADGDFPVKFFVVDIGRRRPLNVGASGIALLAAMPPPEAERILQHNVERTLRKNPRFSIAGLHATIALGRRRGYVVNGVMEVPPVASVGIVVRDMHDKPIAGISVSTLVSRLGRSRLPFVVASLNEAATAITERLARETHRAAE